MNNDKKPVCHEAMRKLTKGKSFSQKKHYISFFRNKPFLSLMILICTYVEVFEDILAEMPGNLELEHEISGVLYPLGRIIREGQIYDSSILRMSDIKGDAVSKRHRVGAIIGVSQRILNGMLVIIPCSFVISLAVIVALKLSK